MALTRGRMLLGTSGRAWAAGTLAGCSGHTTAVVALTATLAVLLLVPPQQARTRPVRALLLGMSGITAAVVATAVIGLRWHYFTDTVAAAAVGAGTVCALALILDLAWRDRAQPAADPAAVTIQARTRASSRQES